MTGKIFLWYGEKDLAIVRHLPIVSDPEPDFFVTSSTDDSNTTLHYQVSVHRQLSVSSFLGDVRGSNDRIEWSQSLSYSNIGDFTAGGNVQGNNMMISGTENSTTGYARKFAFPLQATTEVRVDSDSRGFSIDARLDFSKDIQVVGRSVFPSPMDAFSSGGPFYGWLSTNRQNGSAYYFTDGKRRGSSGSTEQQLVVKGIKAGTHESIPLYSRHVLAANNTLIADSQAMTGILGDTSLARNSDFAPLQSTDFIGGKRIKSFGYGA